LERGGEDQGTGWGDNYEKGSSLGGSVSPLNEVKPKAYSRSAEVPENASYHRKIKFAGFGKRKFVYKARGLWDGISSSSGKGNVHEERKKIPIQQQASGNF